MTGSDDTSARLNISIHRIRHRKTFDAIHYYKQKRENVSDKFCEGIETVYDKERTGTLDTIIQKQQDLERQNKRIDDFVLLVNEWRDSPRALLERYTPDQLRKLNSACMILHYKVEEALTINAGRQSPKEQQDRAISENYDRINTLNKETKERLQEQQQTEQQQG